MSIRGLRFQTNQGDHIQTDHIFSFLNANDYLWYIDNLDTLDAELDINFNVRFTDGQQLLKDFSEHAVHAIFGEFFAFKKENEHVSNEPEINNWDDFVQSSAQIVVLIADCYYIDVYLKDPEVITSCFQFISSRGFTPELIDQTDARYKFKVW
ncbi:DUF2691 family protein [Cohnella sp. GCM10012308]|uniref:DUF2691 family protein n=1 Tax=Cohnella sp. GCM10012308 TaxID=3317329 RepID=UPI0036126BC7